MNKEIRYLVQQQLRGKLPRRDFLGRAAALGVGAMSANALLSQAAWAAGPVKGGTIRIGIQGGSSTDTLDPALSTNSTAAQVGRLWGEPLVELAADGSGLWPRLATEFSASADARVWTFKIRSGVSFSNGKSLTPADVLATMERHAGEESKSGALGLLRDISGMRVRGDSFIVELNKGNADLPYLLTDYHLLMQPGGGKDDPTAAIGTGPYMIKEADPGVRFVAEKNPNYWDSIGHAQNIELIVINDDTARTSAIQSGQVDMINRVPPKVAALVNRMPGIDVRNASGPGHYVFIMHCDTEPFANNDLRLALKYAMNREEMLEKIIFGYGSVGNDSPINASYPLFPEDIEQREYDPDKAAFHYKKSGHQGSVLLRTSDNSFPGAPDAAQLFQQSAAAAGITLEIKREPNDGYWSEVWNKQPFCTSYWGGRSTQDAMFSTAYLSTADWNDTRFFNEQFDQTLIAARSELDTAKRKAMYRDLNMMVRDEGGLICPMFNDFIDATSDKVAGWGRSVGFDLMNFYAPMQMWVVA